MWALKQLRWYHITGGVVLIGIISAVQVLFPVVWISSNPPVFPDGNTHSKQEQVNITYRGARWKHNIGHWLRRCHASATRVSVTEKLYSISCEDECGGYGVCNREFGECRCFHGYAGKNCHEDRIFECNNPPAQDLPFGSWRVSICPAFCDKRRALCFCGQGSKFPERPLAESCGFVINGEIADWGKTDFETVYANQSSKIGWCNVQPEDYYSGKVKLKEHCDCKYDGTAGLLCETPTECSCINQCSGNGVCRGGFCQCRAPWYGIDCSIPSPQVPLTQWPNWLRPANITLPHRQHLKQPSLLVSVARKRPLIYIYDLPPEFNSHLLEGRHYKFECVNRIYNEDNSTFWSDQLYGSEMALLESLLASPHRTMNGDDADFFYVPVLGACAITRADDAPHFVMENHMGLRGYFSGDIYKKAYLHIQDKYPFWNRTSGRDHIWLFPWDEGACSAPKEIWNSTMLVHWGNMNLKHNHSTTAYFADNWDPIPNEWRGNHPCYEPSKDIVIPAWKLPHPLSLSQRLVHRDMQQRDILFYFNGNLGNAYENGRPEDSYSMGIRQKVAAEFGSSPNNKGHLGRQAVNDVIVTSKRSPDYSGELSRSRFCGVFPGDGWSGRMEDSILHGCIPLIIQDGIHLPYENVLDYDSFAVRIAEDDIPNLLFILRNMSQGEVESKLNVVRGIWQRFVYRDSIMLEAEREKKKRINEEYSEWGMEYSKLLSDDVFATLVQILHFKLSNDEWRGVPASTSC